MHMNQSGFTSLYLKGLTKLVHSAVRYHQMDKHQQATALARQIKIILTRNLELHKRPIGHLSSEDTELLYGWLFGRTGLCQNYQVLESKQLVAPILPISLKLNALHNIAWIENHNGDNDNAFATLSLLMEEIQQHMDSLETNSVEFVIRCWQLATYSFQMFTIASIDKDQRKAYQLTYAAFIAVNEICQKHLVRVLEAHFQDFGSQLQSIFTRTTKLANASKKYAQIQSLNVVEEKLLTANRLLELQENTASSEEEIAPFAAKKINNSSQSPLKGLQKGKKYKSPQVQAYLRLPKSQLTEISKFSLQSALLKPLAQGHYNIPCLCTNGEMTLEKLFSFQAYLSLALFLSLCHFGVGATLSQLEGNDFPSVEAHYGASIAMAVNFVPIQVDYIGLLIKSFNQTFANCLKKTEQIYSPIQTYPTGERINSDKSQQRTGTGSVGRQGSPPSLSIDKAFPRTDLIEPHELLQILQHKKKQQQLTALKRKHRLAGQQVNKDNTASIRDSAAIQIDICGLQRINSPIVSQKSLNKDKVNSSSKEKKQTRRKSPAVSIRQSTKRK